MSSGLVLSWVAALSVAAKLAAAQPSTLYLEYTDQQQHKTSRVGSEPIRVPSTERISLTVVLQPMPPGADRSGGERLEVRAENQAPGYFEHRPPPNVSFTVRGVSSEVSRDVLFKVASSGGGLSATSNRLFLLADLDIVVDPALRQAKFRELAARIIAAGRQEPATNPRARSLLDGPEAADRLAGYLAAFGAVYIPPGEYQITAVYRAKGGQTLTTKPARFEVFEAESRIIEGFTRGPRREPPK